MPLIRSTAVLSALLMLPAVAVAQGGSEESRVTRTPWVDPGGNWVILQRWYSHIRVSFGPRR